MDAQDLVNLMKTDREERREAIETVSKIANYLDKKVILIKKINITRKSLMHNRI